jgi:hypothetical protein
MECTGWTFVERLVLWNFSGTSDGGRMGDYSEFFGEIFSLFLVLHLFHYYIIHIHA